MLRSGGGSAWSLFSAFEVRAYCDIYQHTDIATSLFILDENQHRKIFMTEKSINVPVQLPLYTHYPLLINTKRYSMERIK